MPGRGCTGFLFAPKVMCIMGWMDDALVYGRGGCDRSVGDVCSTHGFV